MSILLVLKFYKYSENIYNNIYLIIIYGFYYYIIELAREVCYYRLKILRFYLLDGAEKILIKLIYNNLKIKINIRIYISLLI